MLLRYPTSSQNVQVRSIIVKTEKTYNNTEQGKSQIIVYRPSKIGKCITRNEIAKKQEFYDITVDKSNSGLNIIGTLGLSPGGSNEAPGIY